MIKKFNKKIILGCAQFDFKYGLKKFDKNLTKYKAKRIISLAVDKLNYIDTSPNYGNAESFLGNLNLEKLKVYSKTTSLNLHGLEKVKSNVLKTLKNLKKNQIEGINIHNFEDVKNKNFEKLFYFLNDLKSNKIINKIGFSIYEKKEFDFIIKNYSPDMLQIPVNIFNQSFLKEKTLKNIKRKNIEIHARSIFLQGLLLNTNNYPYYFNKWKKKFNDLNKFVKNNNINLLCACLSFVNSIKELDKVVIGVKNRKQLETILNCVTFDNLDLSSYSITDKKIIDPRFWNI